MYQIKLAAVAKELSKKGTFSTATKYENMIIKSPPLTDPEDNLSFFLGNRNLKRCCRDTYFSLLDTIIMTFISVTLQICDWVTQLPGNSSVKWKLIQTKISVALEQFQSNTISQSCTYFGDFFSSFTPSFFVHVKKHRRVYLVLPI